MEALDEALSRGTPEIFNTDQGSQFTSREYTGRLEEAGVAVSRDGRGRALDNVSVERPWRSVKYEDISIKDYELVPELVSGLTAYFWFYDEDRPHQALDYRTPGEVYIRRSREAEWGRTITNTGRPSCPVFGVHFSTNGEAGSGSGLMTFAERAGDGRIARSQSMFTARSAASSTGRE